jgi:dTMP kinase
VPDSEPKIIPGGFLLAFEGGEGTGKTTQAGETATWLSRELGYSVKLTREPGGSRIGQQIRGMLLDPASTDLTWRAEALLYAADRAQHVAAVIEPLLVQGAVVVTDRYSDSSIAYQGAGRGLGISAVMGISTWAADGREPDLTVLLDMDPQRAMARRQGDADRIESEPASFHVRVREAFLGLADSRPGKYLKANAAMPRENVTAVIRARLLHELSIRNRDNPEIAS